MLTNFDSVCFWECRDPLQLVLLLGRYDANPLSLGSLIRARPRQAWFLYFINHDHVELQQQYGLQKFSNKMGVSNSHSAQHTPDMAMLEFIKKSNIGKHYRHKVTHQQIMVVESNILPALDQKSSYYMITNRLTRRSKLRNKNTPLVLEYSQNTTHFCNSAPGFTLWLLHPAKSLTEEIKERHSLGEVFEEGEIWMIIYGALNALAHLEYFGVQAFLNTDNLFISQHGQIIVSDAYLYSNPNFYTNSLRQILPQQNIEQLIAIITNLIGPDFHYGQYSQALQLLVSKLKSSKFASYQNVCRLVMDVKRQFDCRNKVKQREVQFDGIVEVVMSEFVDASSIEQTPIKKLQIFSHQNSQESKAPPLKLDSRSKHKFHRTTPVRRFELQQISHTPANSMPNVEQNWTQVSEISSISEKMMAVDSDNISCPVNRLFGQDTNSASILWEQNKRDLQGLITKQRNIIFEVSESEVDLSSVQSMRNSYYNPNISLLSTANQ